ncbi:MAG: 4a-hydroxytetrahydrobiopterin dehydratase [Immundisolibacteraceae bacterium]|nr:4a-hydroxytetrahydrobiopterin dehydratase [Immundisolibacteraceae bacterium]
MTEHSALQQLAADVCVPIDGQYSLLEEGQKEQLAIILPASWQVINDRLSTVYRFDNYARSLQTINQIAELAEQQNHHPRLVLEWGAVSIEIWTHVVNGLARGDFVFAAKTAILMMANDHKN